MFAFLLCCHLLVGEGKLEEKSLGQLVIFLHFLKSKLAEDEVLVEEDKVTSVTERLMLQTKNLLTAPKALAKGEEEKNTKIEENEKQDGIVFRPKPHNLSWLKERSWKYFIQFEEAFEELRGMHVVKGQ